MTIISKFLNLPWRTQKLLFKTLSVMVKVRLMLWFMSFPSIQRSFSKIKVSGKKDRKVCDLSWSLKAVSYYMPWSTCLTDALAGYILLSQYGYASLIKIGVEKSAEGEFEAHAWLEYKDRIIIGNSEKEYVPLFDLK